ncbi:MAG: T9SS type A sorting domain-containing protein [Bacteroidales bacterium]|nr:T9SS type A sorting domain-containing protein [Bacteroidales bacterium]
MYKKCKIIVCAGLLCASMFSLSAQISHGGKPYSFKKGLSLSPIDVELLPRLNHEMLLKEEVSAASKEDGFIFGKEIPVHYDLKNAGIWETLPNGARLWRMAVQSTGAYSLNLVFDNFYIPPHSNLFIYTEDKSYLMGSFTAENNNQWGNFATALLPGDAIVLEYYEAPQDYGLGVLNLSTIVHGYKDFFFKQGRYGSSQSCNVDANCSLGDMYPNAKRSVVLILNINSARCSGTLINNTVQDGKPYLLTANHCINTDAEVSKFVFVFNYESTECDSNTEKKMYSINGSTLLARHVHSDFALLLLNDTPTKEFQTYYAGWDRRNIAVASTVCIHHPSGDRKKISKNSKLLDSSNWDDDNRSFPKNTHWLVSSWDTGITEAGSSGSALFNVLEQVVGQLEGGLAKCQGISQNGGSDWFGKIAYSWKNGNNAGQNCLEYWLDPIGTGAETLNGYDPFKNGTGIDNLQQEAVTVTIYPNPGDDIVTIKADAEIQSYNIYTINGQCIKSETIHSSTIDINTNNLSSGIYITKIQTKEHIVFKKLFIRH